MAGTKNSNVNKEVEQLLKPLSESSPIQYKIIRNLIDSVYEDPNIGRPESLSKDIENKLYHLIDDYVKFNQKENSAN